MEENIAKNVRTVEDTRMSKADTIYVCSNCDAQSQKWTGRCLECGAWGSLKEADRVRDAVGATPRVGPTKGKIGKIMAF